MTNKGRPFVGSVRKRSSVRALGQTRSGECSIDCPVCGARTSTRRSRTEVGSHRVGSSRSNSWPCAGSGRSLVLDEQDEGDKMNIPQQNEESQ